MEILFLFIVKFFSIIYGAVYGILASIPVLKEWIARNRIRFITRPGFLTVGNHSRSPAVILDGVIMGEKNTVFMPRHSLMPGESVTFAISEDETVWVWVKLLDMGTGKELILTDKLVILAVSPIPP